jgi:16S rRNA (guanine966-N2)-methyltransferase
MRVIAGEFGGLRLAVPKSVTRPTSDRVREALFSILGGRVAGARVLDLFAGSGALGIEALSRGAATACFVEQNRGAAATIGENLLRARTAPGRARVVCSDTLVFLRRGADSGGPFDLVFADPPYAKHPRATDQGDALLGPGAVLGVLAEGGVFVLESAASRTHGAPPGWRVTDRRRYGGTALWFFERGPVTGDAD